MKLIKIQTKSPNAGFVLEHGLKAIQVYIDKGHGRDYNSKIKKNSDGTRELLVWPKKDTPEFIEGLEKAYEEMRTGKAAEGYNIILEDVVNGKPS